MPTTNSLPVAANHYISLATAITMTTDYRSNREAILDASKRGQDLLPLSETFARAAFDALLAQDGCAGIRIYYSMDSEDKLHAILVGVTEANEDILNNTALNSEDPVIVEVGQRCPPSCPPASDLNT